MNKRLLKLMLKLTQSRWQWKTCSCYTITVTKNCSWKFEPYFGLITPFI